MTVLFPVLAGIMLAGNDISAVLFAIFLGYFGNMGHRPRWLGLGVLLTALSSFMAALPHLIYGSGHDAQTLLHAVDANAGNSTGSVDETGNV